MLLLLCAVGVLIGSGVGALLTQGSPRRCTAIAVIGAVSASAIGLIPAVRVLLGAPNESVRWVWDVPYGAFFVELDALSALFLLPIFGLSAVAAVYGGEYLLAYRERKSLGP